GQAAEAERALGVHSDGVDVTQAVHGVEQDRPQRGRGAARVRRRSRRLDEFADPGDEALIFTGARGGTFRRSNFRRAADWSKNTRKIGHKDLHFHDLRHTGNTLAAASGASLRDLMERMGHDSVRAAMIYQHSTAETDRKIANALDDKINQLSPTDANGSSGTLTR
ncbi:tyrosine-type recombinase/integrase, partial [Nonomuraea sp. NPDC046570]|uniref:tyrosine-type recombinase/integrase n=1 Tax=Nonomuraea sp. NPDC046570 TaxID=3155255 RepID=UPI0033EA2278